MLNHKSRRNHTTVTTPAHLPPTHPPAHATMATTPPQPSGVFPTSSGATALDANRTAMTEAALRLKRVYPFATDSEICYYLAVEDETKKSDFIMLWCIRAQTINNICQSGLAASCEDVAQFVLEFTCEAHVEHPMWTLAELHSYAETQGSAPARCDVCTTFVPGQFGGAGTIRVMCDSCTVTGLQVQEKYPFANMDEICKHLGVERNNATSLWPGRWLARTPEVVPDQADPDSPGFSLSPTSFSPY